MITATPSRAEPLDLVDMAGQHLLLAKAAERIVTLPLPAAPTIVALDLAATRLVGIHPVAQEIMRNGPLGRLFPKLATMESDLLQGGGAFMPNVEALATLAPDLVVQRGELGDGIVEPLRKAGLTTLLVSYGDEAKARANISVLGSAIGRSDRAANLLHWRDAVAGRITAVLGAAGRKPRVLFLSGIAGGFLTTGRATPSDDAIGIAGGTNIAADQRGSSRIGTEQLLLWNPDVIILNSSDAQLTPRVFAEDPVLSTLDAVKAGHVYKAPRGGYRVEPPSPENPLFWLWLTAVLHPDADTFDLRAEFRNGFRQLYGADPAEEEMSEMLQVSSNQNTSRYRQFHGTQ